MPIKENANYRVIVRNEPGEDLQYAVVNKDYNVIEHKSNVLIECLEAADFLDTNLTEMLAKDNVVHLVDASTPLQ